MRSPEAPLFLLSLDGGALQAETAFHENDR